MIAAVWSGWNSALGRTWIQQTNAPSETWHSIASSADGSKLVAVNDNMYFNGHDFVFYGSIYTSTNSGASWTQATNAPPAAWIAVTSSAGGNSLVALPADGPLYASRDSGTTWTPINTPSSFLDCIASSADGTKLAAGAWNDFVPTPSLIYTTTNSGATWATNNAPSEYWTSIASSANGTKLVAVAVNPTTTGPIYTSVDSGITWNVTSAPETNWYAVASSADGVKLIAAVSGGQVYTSIDSGANWTVTGLPSAAWDAVASSADGTRLVAAENYGGTIYTSTDSGVTWIQADVPAASWLSVASSADGNKLVAVSFQGMIYASQTLPSPRLNLTPLGANLVLSWVIPATNFVLQQSSNLISWVNVTNTPTLNLTNLQKEVVLAPSNSSGFFRLSTP
ncbi:MAG: hypothetical protein WCL11_21935 [Verrucomicrobiota bacterium]